MDNIKQVFNSVFAKYQRKDYFSDKEYIRRRIADNAENNLGFVVKYSEIKNFLKGQKQKAYTMILKRIEERKQGKHFPQREKFTNEIFKKLGI
jgi:hypothetical protein